MTYPKAPLVETFKKFVELYTHRGGQADVFRGLNYNNLWEVMLRAAVQNPEELLTCDLRGADGGIEAVPTALGWLEAYKAGETGYKSLPCPLAELRYRDTHRAATFAEALLFAALLPRGKVNTTAGVTLTKETLGFAPDGRRLTPYVGGVSRIEMRLIPQEDLSPFRHLLVVPKQPGTSLVVV